jgi:hypothetical protein
MVEPEGPHMTSQYGELLCMLDKQHYTHANAYPRAQAPACTRRAHTHTHTNMKYLLHFDGNSGFANALQYHVIRTLPVFL